jgi:hypothetical protein
MMAKLTAIIRRAGRDQRGLTIVEGAVAGLMLLVAGLATLQVFDAGARNTYRAEESQVLNDRLQAELEAIRELPYAQIALTAAPPNNAVANDPRWRVSGTRYAVARDGTNLKQMVYNGASVPGGSTVSGGAVDPGPEPFTAGDVSGRIHRFVTWTSDPSCPDCGPNAMKRVIVAATIDQAAISFERRFQEMHTDVVDPEIFPDDNPAPPEDEEETAKAEFWLTDTQCSFPDRQPITADHAAHNTRARCADGAQTGSTPGAPDLLYTQAPKLDPDIPTGEQPIFDYATDSEPAVGAGQDKGLLMPGSSAGSCELEPLLGLANIRSLLDGQLSPLVSNPGDLDGVLDLPTDESNKQLRVHTWLSPKITGQGGILSGVGTLELYSKTVNGSVHPGEICVSLFIRQTVAVPVESQGTVNLEVDVPVVNTGLTGEPGCNAGGLNATFFRCALGAWPTGWTKVSMPMNFIGVDSTGAPIPLALTPGSQVGMSIMVRGSGTQPGQALEFMYDAVGYESRLELETDRVISF